MAIPLLFAAACSDAVNDGFDDASAPSDAGAETNPEASVGTPDASHVPDAHVSPDAAHTPDAHAPPPDSGNPDAIAPDSGPPADAASDASPDAETADANGSDAGESDAASDASASDASASDASAGDASGSDAGEDAASFPTLLGAWDFDEGTGTSSADLSGNGHAAAFVGGATWGTGKEGTGLLLNGSTAYADVGVTLVDTTQSFTVVSWANLTGVNAWEVAVSEDAVNGSVFALKLRGDNNDYDFDAELSDTMSPGFAVAQSTSSGQASTWVHLAGVYDPSGTGTMKIYVNGALQNTTTVGQSLVAGTGHLVIGRGLYNAAIGSFVNGTLDEVAVYGGALSDAQVSALYTAQH